MRALFLLALALSAFSASAQRSRTEVSDFKRENPCPATGELRGACPGYEVDALVCGGPDAKENMQWLTVAQHREKTRYDVKYCRSKRANR